MKSKGCIPKIEVSVFVGYFTKLSEVGTPSNNNMINEL
jgi:hypothetical protein